MTAPAQSTSETSAAPAPKRARDVSRPPAHLDEFGTGLERWNLQAWMDFVVMKVMMSKVGDVIPKTYVPILRLVAEDADAVDAAYRAVVAKREPIRWLDSPRDKWRKMYGAYVRELDWVYDELRERFPTREYQELVIDIMARNIRDAMGAFLPSLEKMTRARESDGDHVEAHGRKRGGASRFVEKAFVGPMGRFMWKNMNPMSAIVGPVEMKMEGREIELFIPRCWMHTAPLESRTMDQACVQGCKGACEKVFNGNTPVAMLFEPHLPEYSCTLRVSLGETAAPRA